MRILGIDPGTAIVGWGVLEIEGSRITPIAYGHITTSPAHTLSERIAEISENLREIATRYTCLLYTSPAIERVGDLGSILTNLENGDVLFIDEIHRLNKLIEEVLYPAMEDYKLDIIIGKGPSARTIQLDLPKFTLIGATTRLGSISNPLRNRFGSVHRLEFYSEEEIARILDRSSRILNVGIDSAGASRLARASRRTPRVANRLLKRARDFAQSRDVSLITDTVAEDALHLLEIDHLGLEPTDRHILTTLIDKFAGGPVGVQTLAAATSEERETIEDVYEPYLIQLGFLARTPRGRIATPEAYTHLGKKPPLVV